MNEDDLPEWAEFDNGWVVVDVPETYDGAMGRYQRSALFNDVVSTVVFDELECKSVLAVSGLLAKRRGRGIAVEVERLGFFDE